MMSVTTGIALDYSNVFPNHPCGTIHVVDRNYMTCYAVSEISPRSCRHRHVRACGSDTARAWFRLNWTLRGLGDQPAELQTEAREGLCVGHCEGLVQTQLDSTRSRRSVRGVADTDT